MSTHEETRTFLDMARERWSVRKFKQKQISGEHMARILEAGRCAPSACNYQPQRVLVLQSDEAIARMRQVAHWAFNAPTVLLVCADLTESWKNVAMMPMGYPADNAKPSKWHFNRKGNEEL